MLGGWEPDVVFTLLFQTGFVSDSLLLIVAVGSEFRSALVKRIVRFISAGGRRLSGRVVGSIIREIFARETRDTSPRHLV